MKADWTILLTNLLDESNAALARGDRELAAQLTAKGSELLFMQAKLIPSLDDKKRLAQRANELLETSLILQGKLEMRGERPSNTDPVATAAAISTMMTGKPLDAKPVSGGNAPGKPARLMEQAEKSGESRAAKNVKFLTFDDIAGLDEVKRTLRLRVIYPLLHPEKLQTYNLPAGGGMLLYGPPGTGKTLLARAVAGELQLPFYVIKSSEVLSQYYGQSEKQLADLFAEAKSDPDGAVVFVDEIDAIGAARTEQMNEASRRLLTQLLQELDGVEGRSEKLVFLAATNEPWLLDTALLRPPRFCEQCYIPLPDAAARMVLFRMSLKNCPVDNDCSLEELVAQTDGYSGADIVNVCQRAKLFPYSEAIHSDIERPVNRADFAEAMQTAKPSVTPGMLKRFEDWANRR